MIDETVSKIEARLNAAEAISPERKQELLQLLGTLKAEISKLSKTHGEEAARIVDLTDTTMIEATRPEQNSDELQSATDSLSSSVEGFEKSHPKLVQIVNSISHTLSNLGI